jgi:hypothetical protein
MVSTDNGYYLPYHHHVPELSKYTLFQWLCKYISHLVLCTYMMYAYSAFLYLFPEVVIFQVQVLCMVQWTFGLELMNSIP